MATETLSYVDFGAPEYLPTPPLLAFDPERALEQSLSCWNKQRPKRKQNRSCDACRESKRACDVGCVAGDGLDDASNSPWSAPLKQPHLASRPCTNCTKRRKRCTVNWLLSKHAGHKSDTDTPRKRARLSKDLPIEGHPPSNVDFADNGGGWAPLSGFTQTPSTCGQQTVDFGYDTWPGYAFDDVCPDAPILSDCNVDGLSPLDIGAFVETGWNRSDLVDQKRRSEASPVSLWSSQPPPSATDELDTEVTERSRRDLALSPLSTHSLSANNHRTSIKKGLLKIYHDSLEGALSCWLTERNCPYVVARFDSGDAWSSDWSNRIILRVCALERATSGLPSARNRNESQASQALDLAITAFAAQWTHGDEFNGSTPVSSVQSSRSEDAFDRTLQKSLWHQAFSALTEASANPSFKVIFALIIFSLTQRPLEDEGTVAKTSSMADILKADTTPMFLEIALRQLHDVRRTLLFETRKTAKISLGVEAKNAFDMLFWLAIMFDTLSAAMYQRPFVVRDDEGAVQKPDIPEHSQNTPESFDLNGWCGTQPLPASHSRIQLWGDYFLQASTRSGDVRKSCTRWPCSYDDAAAALCDAAPVKVLLFRRVGQLRDLVCAPCDPPSEAIERAIDVALDVYDHWNATYGLFIADCTQNHEHLPARVQSWYILLAGHWHLAVFSLADLIDDVDAAGLGDTSHRRLRQMSGFTEKLRSESAVAVSELGRCSQLSDRESSFSQSRDFHSAVSKAALLTEPWTAVLVQSFGKAGEILATRPRGTLRENTDQQLRYCIAALAVLSRKSDMAARASRYLEKTLDDVQ